MKSKAVLMGHPLHVMLTPFPIAFLIGAALFDAGGWMFAVPRWSATGRDLSLAGIATALLTAIPGLIDYVYTVPPRSSANTRATRHLLMMIAVVACFAAALWTRRSTTYTDVIVVGFELIGVGLLAVGGFMGGTLLTRNLIGIDHRYARAGKWSEARFVAQPGQAITVARRDELQVDQMKLLHVDHRRIVLARTEQGYVAFDDRCTHRGGSLAGGVMVCGTVQCLWHGSQFDVATGKVKAGPATADISVYQVTVRGDDVTLAL